MERTDTILFIEIRILFKLHVIGCIFSDAFFAVCNQRFRLFFLVCNGQTEN